MGQIRIANYFECDRLSAVASTGAPSMVPGMICYVTDDGAGQRLLTPLANTDSAKLVTGNYCIVTKELVDMNEVTDSTASAESGIRVTTIHSGDAVLELRRGAKVEYPSDMLDASLDPIRSGTPPTVGQALGIVGSLPCATSAASAITSPVVLRVLRVFSSSPSFNTQGGISVVVELL